MKATQLSKPAIITIIVFIVGDVLLYVYGPARIHTISWTCGIFLIGVMILFYNLTVSIDAEKIKLRFGIGLIRNNFNLSEIATVKIVKNPFWVGWGIRIGNGYVLYNASGFKAIELSFKDRSQKVRIGVEDPDAFANYLNRALAVTA